MKRLVFGLIALAFVGLGFIGGTLTEARHPQTVGGSTFAVTGVMPLQVLAQGGDGYRDSISSTTYTVLRNSSVTITLSKPEVIWYSVFATGRTSGSSGEFASMHLFLDDSDTAIIGIWDNQNAGYTSSSSTFTLLTPPLSPGPHTIDLRVAVEPGQTWTNYVTGMVLFGPGPASTPAHPGTGGI